MRHNTMAIAVGDWVHSDSPGIWRVYRIIEGVQRPRFSLQERRRVERQRFVFVKRLVDESWKPAFANEVANADLLRPLSNDDRAYLEEFISANAQLLQEFEALQPKPIDEATDFLLGLPVGVGKADLESLVKQTFADIGEEGLTNDEVLQRLAASPLRSYVSQRMINAVLRFICKDHELRGNEYVFREAHVIMV